MTRKTRSLWIALAALALILGAFFVLRSDRDAADDAGSPAQVETVALSDLDITDLRSVTLIRSSGEVEISSADGETWFVRDVPVHYRGDGDRIRAAVRGLAGLSSRNVVAESASESELADFGLDPAEATVVLRQRDGSETAVDVGKPAPSGSGRYARRRESSRVVILPAYAVDPALSSADDFRDRSLPAPDPDRLVRISYRSSGTTVRIEEREGGNPFTSLSSPLDVTEPWLSPHPADDYALRKALAEEAPLPRTVGAFLDDADPEDPDLGLSPRDDADLLRVEDADGVVLDLVIGSEDGAGNRYALRGDEDGAVFTLPVESLAFLEVDPFDLTSNFVFLGSIERMRRIRVERGSESWIMAREERGEPGDTKDDGYRVNRLEVPREEFTAVYQEFISLMWEGRIQRNVPLGTPELRITAEHADPDVNPLVILFWPYDDVYYQVAVGDDPMEFLVGRYQVGNFLDDLAALSEYGS